MPSTQLLCSSLLTLTTLLTLRGQGLAQDKPATEAPSEEGAAGAEDDAKDGDGGSDSLVEKSDTGLSFRINQRLTSKVPGGSHDGENIPPRDGTDKSDLVSACDSVTVVLKRGNLSARNSSKDMLLSFSELPPGSYEYTATCSSSGHGSGSVEGLAEVVAGRMSMLPITIEVTGRNLIGVMLASGAAIGLAEGSPDLKGGDLDSKTRSLTILADLGYITSDNTHQGIAPLAFTDLGVWSIAAAFTPERRLAIGGKVTGLAKSPEFLDVRVIQNAGTNLSYAFGRHLALSAGGQWQAGLDSTRSVISTGGGVIWSKQHAEFVKTEFSIGAEGVMHRGKMDDNRSSAFATGSAEVQLCWNHCSRRYGATWFGFDAAIPMFHSDDSADLIGAKANSALGFHVGSFMRVNDTFDLFANVAWRDRGDAAAPKTEFGTLLGGFDQIQMSLGAIFYFHFGKEKSRSDSDYVRAL